MKTKIAGFNLILGLASLMMVAPAIALPATLTAQDAEAQINVRSEPSPLAKIEHYGLVGDRVETVQKSQGNDGFTWYYVRFNQSGATGWVRSDLVSVQSPPSSQSPQDGLCDRAIDSARQRLSGVKHVTVTTVKTFDLAQGYSDFPPNRSIGYQFVIDGQGVETVMTSSVFLTNISQQIVRKCGSVASVTFGVNQTDWGRMFGLVDNTIQPFSCIEAGIGQTPKWGEAICF